MAPPVVAAAVWAVVAVASRLGGYRFTIKKLAEVTAKEMSRVIAHVTGAARPVLQATTKNPRGVFKKNGQLSRASHVRPVGRGQFWNAEFREAAKNPKVATLFSNFREGMSRERVVAGLISTGLTARVANLMLDNIGGDADLSEQNPPLRGYQEGDSKPWYSLFKLLEDQGENVNYNTWDKLMAEYYRKHPEGRGWTPTEGTTRVLPVDEIVEREPTRRTRTRASFAPGNNIIPERLEKNPQIFPNLSEAPGTAGLELKTERQRKRQRKIIPRILEGKTFGKYEPSPTTQIPTDIRDRKIFGSREVREDIQPDDKTFEVMRRLKEQGGNFVDASLLRLLNREDMNNLGITQSGFVPKGTWKKYYQLQQNVSVPVEEEETRDDFKKGGSVKRKKKKSNKNKVQRTIIKPYTNKVRKPQRA